MRNGEIVDSFYSLIQPKAVFRVYQMDYPDYAFYDTLCASRRVLCLDSKGDSVRFNETHDPL